MIEMNGSLELPNKTNLPTKRDPRRTFHVQCFGHEVSGLIYREFNHHNGKIYWIFRVDMDGAEGCARCAWRTEAEALANSEDWQRGHLRFALECWCAEAREQMGMTPLQEI